MPSSPLPKQSPTKAKEVSADLTFPEAIKAVCEGKAISKREWKDPACFGKLRNFKLQIFLADGKWHDWIVNDGDMSGADWFVLDIDSD